jgi:hypothetical protein
MSAARKARAWLPSERLRILSHVLRSVVAAVILLLAVGEPLSAQEPPYWSPRGDERWILQTYQTDIVAPLGLVADSNWQNDLQPQIVIVPLFSGDTSVKPLSADQIAAYHQRDIRVVCTVAAGYWDQSTPDAKEFSPSMIGRTVWGDSGRRWLDIRNTGVRSLMDGRFAHAAEIGCDGIDATYLELWYQNTGFFITYGDQLAFNRYLADSAHSHGLSIGLHNTTQQIADLAGWYDFAIAESCLQAAECGIYTPFKELGKPVFQVEYDPITTEIHVCNASRELGYNTIIKGQNYLPPNAQRDTFARACQA